ncbi:MAG: helix-turn-helix transcriptional regulator [Gammaproteobacteria bacterium]|nr:helix-turn-helix transcriptional regulator [Gammaproteobacteria bacterium]
MYWEKVLNEVANKSSTSRSQFTSINCKAATTTKRRAYNNSLKTRRFKKEDAKQEQEQEIRFTRRETECLVCFLQGKTASQTAEDLELSPRTVEFYVKNMRQKVGCGTKAELIRIVSDGDFIRLWEDNEE